MFSLGYNLLMAVKVFLVFILIYIFVPSRFIRFPDEAKGFLDKVFISLIHSTIITILIVHALVFLKLYETFSLLFCCLGVYLSLAWVKGRSPAALADALGMKLLIRLFDMAESKAGLWGETKEQFQGWIRRQANNVFQILKKAFLNPFTGIFPVLILIGAAWIRFKHSIIHAGYSAFDSYVHLIWLKYTGTNQIYYDSIYPHGYHAIISAIAKLTFIDPYWLIRFLGPINGMMLVLSVYYFSFKVTKSRTAALISLVVYGLVTDVSQFPSFVVRQTAALPQECASIFILPGLYFLWTYLDGQKRSFLLLYAEALALAALIHPFAVFYFILWSVVLIIIAIPIKKLNIRLIFSILVYSFLSGIISLLPFLIGLLKGKEFDKGTSPYIQTNIIFRKPTGSPIDFLSKLVTHNPFFDIALMVSLSLIIYAAVTKKKDLAITSLTISGCSIIMYLLYLAPRLNLPQVTDSFRAGLLLALIFSVLYASGFNMIENFLFSFSWKLPTNVKQKLSQIGCIVLCLIVIYKFPVRDFDVRPIEYDAAAENYVAVSNRFPILDWTIIGPTEQFQQAMGKGWHYEILRFVQKFDLAQAKDPKFVIPIPTHHIFFYTERRPLHLGRVVMAADAERELEPEGNNPFLQYYQNPVQRAIIEAKAISWIEAYQKSHPNVSVFYEDADLKIYHIYHEPKELSGRV